MHADSDKLSVVIDTTTAKSGWSTGLAVAVFLLLGRNPIHAASLKKLWDIDLRKILDAKGAGHTRDLPVFALRFSPDGQQVAVVADWYGAKGAENSHLLVIQLEHPGKDVRVFEIEAGIDDVDGRTGGLGWSPSGEIVHAGTRFIRLKGGAPCELPRDGVFIGDDLVMARDRGDFASRDWAKLVSHFTFFDANCKEVGKWEVPEEWTIVDVSADRGLLSVSRTVHLPRTMESLIVDPVARAVVHRWSEDSVPAGVFADYGKAMCGGSDVDAADRAPVTCWDVDTGRKISEAPTIGGGDPMATAQHSSRVVASDCRRRKILFSYEYLDVFKRRVVWDFRSGKELLSWRPDFQSWDFQLFIDPQKPLKHVNEPFRFAISPDGQYICQDGSGAIHLYRIER